MAETRLARLAAALLLTAVLSAQEPVYRLDYESLAATHQLLQQRREIRRETTDPAALERLDREIFELERRFAQFASGLDSGEMARAAGEFDLQSELLDLLQPVIQSLRDATAGPREVDALKRTLTRLDERLPELTEALRNAQSTVEQLEARGLPAEDPMRLQAAEVVARWRGELDRARAERRIAQGRLDARQQDGGGVVDSVVSGAEGFFRALFAERALNLLLAAVAFLATFLGLRFVQQRATRRRRSAGAGGGAGLPWRLLDVVLHALAVLLAAIAAVAVFFARNDWLLLSIALVFLIGVAWAAVRAMPVFAEQLRLLLNIGSVREGERIVFGGLPYRVDSLRLYSYLDNPDLAGGRLRVPIRDLVGLRSRVAAEGEPWFPTRVGDRVVLADGTFGRIDLQTPEQVVVTTYVTQRTYTTPEFLTLSPRNLSRGFHVEVAFGIDYSLQEQSTTLVPERMAAALRERLVAVVDTALLQHVVVELRRAGNSALEYHAMAWFDGGAAAHYEELQRAMVRILVDVCTENGWPIPFQQLTVHRAAR